MQRNFIHLNYHYFLSPVLFSLFFISCVYFNTFYNAETSFKKALKIIEESPIINDDELPNQAKKLLGEAIENSKLVLKDYPESKYVDDAIFIIAKASFLRHEVAIAKSHFNLLLQDYPESKFYSLSEIWLAYTHFRMGMVDSAKTSLEIIQEGEPINKEKLYIIHNLLAEIAIEVDSTEQVYYHYELATEYAPSDSKKTSTFGKLVKIAEKDQNKERASIYLEKLGKVAPNNIRIDSKMQWIIYQRELRNFDKIIDEIESMLGLSEFEAEYMNLELELGKVYMDRGDIQIAKDIFSNMVEKYSKKDETSEAYYHLGHMSLIEDFNLDLAKEYFEKSKSEKGRSIFGNESKELLNKINRFESLQRLYKDVLKNPDKEIEYEEVDFEYQEADFDNEDDSIELEYTNPEDKHIDDIDGEIEYDVPLPNNRSRNSRSQMNFDIDGMFDGEELQNENEKGMGTVSVNPDSVLFMIGEMLLYDFKKLELSLEKFKLLANEYPQSGFAPQALYVLSHFEPDDDWLVRLETDFPNSTFLTTDSTTSSATANTFIESQRDHAWSLAYKSYKDSYEEFNRLFSEEKDTLSGYIRGFISDVYLNDMELAVTHYRVFVDSFPDHSYSSTVENRLIEIKKNIEDIRDISQQGIDYQIAVNYLHKDFNYDSVKVLLTKVSSGRSSPYKDAANNLKTSIRDYKELFEEVSLKKIQSSSDSTIAEMAIPVFSIDSEIDSILFKLAELFSYELEFLDSAEYYHKEVVETYVDSKFRPYSLLYLSEIFPQDNWAQLLAEEYPDTTFIPDSTIHHSIYLSEILQEDFVSRQEEIIKNCELYLELFPEPLDSSFVLSDSTGIKLDSLFLLSDTTETQIYSDSLHQIFPAEKEEITP